MNGTNSSKNIKRLIDKLKTLPQIIRTSTSDFTHDIDQKITCKINYIQTLLRETHTLKKDLLFGCGYITVSQIYCYNIHTYTFETFQPKNTFHQSNFLSTLAKHQSYIYIGIYDMYICLRKFTLII